MIGAIIALFLGGFFVVAAISAVKRFSLGKIKATEDTLLDEIRVIDKSLLEEANKSLHLVPAALLAEAQKLIKEATDTLEKDRNQLKNIETKLDTAQKTVEEKEVAYQEKRSAKEDEEKKIIDIKTIYETESGSLIELEKKLSESMKSLDKILTDLELTPAQKGAIQDLSDTLNSAAARLRELMMEYQAVSSRIERLSQQHKDLEEEYTKLVEKQLGA